MKEIKLCKQCGKEFLPCHKTSVFCSKSCATSFRNLSKMKDGSHNFYNLDRSSLARSKVLNGTHPFLSGNMSEDALKRKAEGIKKARILEAQEHRHAWQDPKNFINNEYSRSLSSIDNRKVSELVLYIGETEFENTFKIGWTYDLKIREKDSRTTTISNLKEIMRGNPKFIVDVEKMVKEKFFSRSYYDSYKSTEIFPNSIKDKVLDYINSLNNPQRLSL